jgi:hypothetical protein
LTKRYFKIESEEHSIQVQQYLFSQGYDWYINSGGEARRAHFTEEPFLVVKELGGYDTFITYCDDEDWLQGEGYKKAELPVTTVKVVPDTVKAVVQEKLIEYLRDVADELAEGSGYISDKALNKVKTLNDFIKA